jgi:hypothetical protein
MKEDRVMLRKLTIALLISGALAGIASEASAYWRGGHWGGGWRGGGWGRAGWGGGWGWNRGWGGWGWGGLGLGYAAAYPYYNYYDYGYYPAYTTTYSYGGCW